MMDTNNSSVTASLVVAPTVLLSLFLLQWTRWRRRRLDPDRLSERLRETYMKPHSGLELRIGLDIGGSLAKLTFLEKDGVKTPFLDFIVRTSTRPRPAAHAPARRARPSAAAAQKNSNTYGNSGVRDEALAVSMPELGGRMHFVRFETGHVRNAVELMKARGTEGGTANNLEAGFTTMYATGGGAHKFKGVIEESLGCELTACSELGTAAVTRRSVPLRTHDKEPRTSSERAAARGVVRVQRDLSGINFFPFLLCNVGTGCSILKVTSESQFERVSGTALGGGTFLGLCRRLTKAASFKEAPAMDMAEDGDARKVDMLDRAGLQLPGDLTASFFARALSAEPKASDADLCKALVVMISQNLAQIAHLNAQVHGLRRVFFTGARRGGREGGAEGRRTSREAQGWGNFLRGNDLAMRTIVYTLQRMPRVVVHGELGRRKRETRGPSLPPASDLLLPVGAEPTEAVFFRHEGYFGAIGAYLEQCRNCASACPRPTEKVACVQKWYVYVALGGVFSWIVLLNARLHPALALAFVVPFMPADGHHAALHAFEHAIKAPVDLGMFFFTLANAGIDLKGGVGGLTFSVLLALALGKVIGIAGFAYLAHRFGVARLPGSMRVTDLLMVGIIAAVGLTVALFISGEAFTDEALAGEAKMGSLLSICMGAIALALGQLPHFKTLAACPPPKKGVAFSDIDMLVEDQDQDDLLLAVTSSLQRSMLLRKAFLAGDRYFSDHPKLRKASSLEPVHEASDAEQRL
ncbi:Na+/H+ antiporter [Emiliania huxleyi CCMP1516]|uniref:Uncharacterized protein n=2 Tax=Emiliania huxleyi TaxID=2903 RepID=A0A0D3IG38_EMIH1|nr:Na+/H+ antiporter [Emiliania huxleyi CCMP1516]EOD10223.1 Na+/H+ antiporter [Emiliania huxleyi CCMP1516]|eukprot:XP_005762652.1 Na+/H+ antiporter [Emiliania huxleyi CCMP1516]